MCSVVDFLNWSVFDPRVYQDFHALFVGSYIFSQEMVSEEMSGAGGSVLSSPTCKKP